MRGMYFDPEDDQIVYTGAEINGIRRSCDGGETWVTVK